MIETQGRAMLFSSANLLRARRRRYRIARRNSFALSDFASANRREPLVDDRADPFEDDLHDEARSESPVLSV
ncbi:MAG: hypothetical protein JHD07_03540 [Bradyrhizobium sp.]|jgi:hypothetical protein|nr:hypothetical protein [Bradyrhizobium sp.]